MENSPHGSEDCPNQVLVTQLDKEEPEYLCGCVQLQTFDDLIATYRKHQKEWDLYLDEQQLAVMYGETPSERRRRNSKAKKITTQVIEGISK